MHADLGDAERFRRFEHDGWQEVAASYQDSFGRLTAQAVPALLDAAEVGSATRLLDLACGTGIATRAGLDRGATVIGVDLVEAMLAEARTHCPEARLERADAEALPFPEASFDAVVCNFGVLHFPRPERAVAEAARVLARGGRLALSAWCPPERSPYLALVMDAVRAHGQLDVGLPSGPPAYRFGEPETCAALLGEAGFDRVLSRVVEIDVVLADETRVLDPLYQGGVRSRKLLEAQAPAARAAIEAAAVRAAATHRTGNTVTIVRTALITSAVLAA